MKVLLVNPPRYGKLPVLRDEICFQDVNYVPFPLRLAQLASILKERGHAVEIVDCNALNISWKDLEGLLRQKEYDILLFQSADGLLSKDAKTAHISKQQHPGAAVVLLETVIAPVFPERVFSDYPDIDYILLSVPETTFPDLVDALSASRKVEEVAGLAYREGGLAKRTAHRPVDINMDSLPFLAYDLLPMEKYSIEVWDRSWKELKPAIRFRSTRGCPFGCKFCIIGSSDGVRGYDRGWRFMSPERVIDELEYVKREYGIKGVYFWDETFTLDQERAKRICELMIERDLDMTWRCLTRVDCVNPELLKLMKKAGCVHIEYGIESASDTMLKRMGKKNTSAQQLQAIKWTRDAGISFHADMIVGLPGESKETLEEDRKFIKKIGADLFHLSIAFPYPATDFYREAVQKGLLEVDDIYEVCRDTRIRVGNTPLARTEYLSIEELKEEWKKMRKLMDKETLTLSRILTGIRRTRSPQEFVRKTKKLMSLLR